MKVCRTFHLIVMYYFVTMDSFSLSWFMRLSVKSHVPPCCMCVTVCVCNCATPFFKPTYQPTSLAGKVFALSAGKDLGLQDQCMFTVLKLCVDVCVKWWRFIVCRTRTKCLLCICKCGLILRMLRFNEKLLCKKV